MEVKGNSGLVKSVAILAILLTIVFFIGNHFGIFGSEQSNKTKLSTQEAQLKHLGKVDYACTVDGFEWVFAHIDYPADASKIGKTLNELGFEEMAETWDKLFQLYAIHDPVFTYDGKLPPLKLSQEAAYNAFLELEKTSQANGVCERYVQASRPILVEAYGDVF